MQIDVRGIVVRVSFCRWRPADLALVPSICIASAPASLPGNRLATRAGNAARMSKTCTQDVTCDRMWITVRCSPSGVHADSCRLTSTSMHDNSPHLYPALLHICMPQACASMHTLELNMHFAIWS